MKKLSNEIFFFIFFVVPFLLIYSKGYDYWKETVLEPRIKMKCGDGEPIVEWHNSEEYQIPTHDCAKLEYYMEYNKWFLVIAKDFIAEHSPTYEEIKVHIIEMIGNIIELINIVQSR